MKLGGAGNRNDPGLLREQPCKRNLRRRYFLFLRKITNQVNYSLVRLAVFRREARNDVAKVVLVELSVVVDLAGEEAFPQWTEWNESDAKFLQRRDDFRFRLPEPQRIFALQRGDGLNGVRAADGFCARFRESEMFYLALLDEILHRASDVFDGHVRIDAVLIKQVNDAGLQAFERCFSDFLDVRSPTVQPGLFAGVRINFEAELRGDGHLFTEGSERFADEVFVSERAVDFGGI